MAHAKEERREYWQGHIDSWRSQGVSKRAYCQAQGISLSAFQYWTRRLEKASAPKESQPKLTLIPARVSADKPAVQLTMSYDRKWQLQFSELPSPEWLSRVLGVSVQGVSA